MTIIELATGVVAVCGAIGAVIHNSRCSKISCCGILCEREVLKLPKEGDKSLSRESSSSDLSGDDFSKALELRNKIEDKV